MSGTPVYVVMKSTRFWDGEEDPFSVPQEFQGVFSTAERASLACRDCLHSYSEFILDEELPQESSDGVWIKPNDSHPDWYHEGS